MPVPVVIQEMHSIGKKFPSPKEVDWVIAFDIPIIKLKTIMRKNPNWVGIVTDTRGNIRHKIIIVV